MSIQLFIQKDNINMLWELITDEEIYKFLSRDMQIKLYNLFITNIQGFFDIEKITSNSLVDMNKKYILLILNYIKKYYQPNKIIIYQEPIKEAITFEDIQNEKKTQFDNDLSKRMAEFKDYMDVKPPPIPEFSDNYIDKPIKEIDKILKEMQVQRNYEIEKINRNLNNNNSSNWLKPKETSIKNDKLKVTNEIKKVSFNDIKEIKLFKNDDYEDNDIFSKLKTIIPSPEEKLEPWSGKHTVPDGTQEYTFEYPEDIIYKNTLQDIKDKTIYYSEELPKHLTDLNSINNQLTNLQKNIENINNKIDKIIEHLHIHN